MNFDRMLERAKRLDGCTVSIAGAADVEVIRAVKLATDHGLSRFILFGDAREIKRLCDEHDIAESTIDILHVKGEVDIAKRATLAVRNGEADVLMKGMVSTSVFMKAVLSRESGLRTSRTLSHVALFQIPNRERLIGVTDAAIHIAPTLEEKVDIIHNAVGAMRDIGYELPRVAAIAAVEVVNPQMTATMDAALLAQMNRRGQIKGCVVDGPLALDNAVDMIAAKQKGIASEVAGQADLLLVPYIEVGNVLYKSIMYFAGASVAAIVVGASAPVVLTSRADTAEAKLYSLAFALLHAKK
ncbi:MULTISPECIES: phosphate butyryltransferase [unclassified Exiguobacterium]|uniref:phosphate butyryltransferase n=1 Tax=unclassified Exiguobacterium TaxID=2644629 RepID=UPI00103A7C33|nr:MULTISPECIES: phosphate butyryltransferase [unclassified Exiguobacterium]TCI47650.1 phosphate butyryltransferase [Exiguobacterium sp. SH5S32]TCI54536.1 phosphate butyryltransferase [Exiguobacterium sp. SH1S4]TCI61386.1 phosphate butyryltransferase [Exiguobacterium sp. SH0S2]TCI74330.1 phosphate butyryltransferase [Exiguobacterium sp. SH1S1]TCI80621.1 phosphate butyryltransferase [Exiguobacterium sp. SH0S1]